MKLHSLLSSIGLACTGAVLISSTAFAAEPVTGVYIGGGLAYSSASGLGGKIDSAMAAQGLGTSSTADSSSTNPNVRLGYQLNSNFAIEGSYDRVGTMNVQSAVSTPSADTASGTWKAHGLGLSVVGRLPIDNKWSVYGRLGAEQWRTSLNLTSNTGGATNAGTSSITTGLVTGLGTAYSVSRNIDATAEYIHYDRVGSTSATGQTGINSFNLGMNYHFM